MADYIMEDINMSPVSSQVPTQDSYFEFELGKYQLSFCLLCVIFLSSRKFSPQLNSDEGTNFSIGSFLKLLQV